MTDEEINVLYEKKTLGNETPEALLYILWLNYIIYFLFQMGYITLQFFKLKNFSRMKDKQNQERGKILSTFAKSNNERFALTSFYPFFRSHTWSFFFDKFYIQNVFVSN